ncbi:hypothetical protein M0R88_11915 [Halorussus gelatinilyticus]|uniref:Halobacterial output domain-containing protein n=1 Tax=Halorussus gelatinilyticus TaxID=2937524 RepID=A0A8U0IG78_9EURY|nr:hypothetical protein [Halorussus gelatinilyticus]UPV99231.1 hypothetical protein M0R88_11915 [Halorussus gelatinilyticus]
MAPIIIGAAYYSLSLVFRGKWLIRPMSTERTGDSPRSLTRVLAEKIAQRNGYDGDCSEFCLYEETDAEALEAFVERTDGPLTTEVRLFETVVTIRKNRDGETTVSVEPVNEPVACD